MRRWNTSVLKMSKTVYQLNNIYQWVSYIYKLNHSIRMLVNIYCYCRLHIVKSAQNLQLCYDYIFQPIKRPASQWQEEMRFFFTYVIVEFND